MFSRGLAALVIALTVIATALALEPSPVGIKGDPCAFTRQDGAECIRRYVDTDHDENISVAEIAAARSKYMTTTQKVGSWLASWFTPAVTNEGIVRNCDIDGDGRFTVQDFLVGGPLCLPRCPDLMQMKAVCDRAAAEAGASH